MAFTPSPSSLTRRAKLLGGSLGIAFDHADERKLAERVGNVHPISNDEIIWTLKTDIVGFQIGLASHSLGGAPP